MSTWSQRILKHDHGRNFWSSSILGNSVIRTDLSICSAEHQEFVSFSATTNLIPICYAGKWRRGRKFFDVSSLLVTDYHRPRPCCRKEINWDKKKNRPSSNSEGGRHCCDSKSQVLNTLKNVVVRFLVTHFFDPTHFVFVNSTEKYFFEKRLLCKQECIWPKSTKIHTPAQKPASKYLIPEN